MQRVVGAEGKGKGRGYTGAAAEVEGTPARRRGEHPKVFHQRPVPPPRRDRQARVFSNECSGVDGEGGEGVSQALLTGEIQRSHAG